MLADSHDSKEKIARELQKLQNDDRAEKSGGEVMSW